MKIGLITIYDVPNYGTILQAYATKKILERLGANVTTIQYTRNNDWVKKRYHLKSIFSVKDLIHKLGLTSYGRMIRKQDSFRKKFLGLSKKYDSLLDLEKEDWCYYDLMVTGSDQVWNAKYLYGDSVYMLSFVPETVKKIAISSSFASNSLPNQYLEKYKKFLDRYSAISVREENGKSIIHDQLSISSDVPVLLDPTLLLSKDQWLKSLNIGKRTRTEKYILFYMLDYAFEPKPYIYEVTKYFQKKIGCKIVALVGYNRGASRRFGLHMIDASDSSISDYLEYFSNAALVITSSFHGTAFAVNFGIPLVSIIPTDGGDDRQTTLIRDLNILNCAVPLGKPLNEINPYYDFCNEQKTLEVKREESLEWIRKNVIGNE